MIIVRNRGEGGKVEGVENGRAELEWEKIVYKCGCLHCGESR